jgi:polyisoprenoid-binding protein YceI
MGMKFLNTQLQNVVTTVLVCLSVGAFSDLANAQPAPKLEREFSKQPSGDYVLDKAHASVTWRVMHMGLSAYTARFDKVDGKLAYTPATASSSRVEFTIDATSVNTGLVPFNKKLNGAEWFDGEKNPNITFKSTKIEAAGDNKYKMTGDMTLRGVTKPMTWDVTFNGGLYNSFAQAHAVGFSAKGIVKRSDWGMKEYVPMISDDVEVNVEVEFNLRQAATQ